MNSPLSSAVKENGDSQEKSCPLKRSGKIFFHRGERREKKKYFF
jgi:hypothetical protein